MIGPASLIVTKPYCDIWSTSRVYWGEWLSLSRRPKQRTLSQPWMTSRCEDRRSPLCKNEMNIFSTYRINWPGEPPEDGEMIEMTLSSRHRIRNSSPGGLRPSTLPLGHGGSPQYWLSHVDGEETFFVSFRPPRPGTELRTLAWKAAVLATTLGPWPCSSVRVQIFILTVDP